MEIRLKKAIAETIGLKKFIPFGIDDQTWRYRGSRGASVEISISRMSKEKLVDFEKLFLAHAKLRGVKVILNDIEIFKQSQVNNKGVKPRTVRQFESVLVKYLLSIPGHRLFSRYGSDRDNEDPDEDSELIAPETLDAAEDTWLCYYANSVEYTPAVTGERAHPAYVTLHLIYTQFGGMKSRHINFYESACRGMNCAAALAGKGLYAEVPTMRDRYLKTIDRFGAVTAKIGAQYLAVGVGVDDPDGNEKGRDSSWYWNRQHNIDLVRNGEPTRVVVDIFYEDGNKSRERVPDLKSWFWENKARGINPDEDADDEDATETAALDEMPVDEDTAEETPIIEIPIHPWLVVFDLAKHLRLRVHIDQLTEYVYDPHLADKLILSPERKSLIKLLIETKQSAFRDIVKGKAGGSVVLLTGPPGVGKTLTAEVYAESEGRALYSIQCSQLGINPDNIEDELLKTFARARRWNAVMLLDESDVYVHERGNDLQQNAIVGVFLRVLEYQSAVLFLTTNRPDDVDDAIASRCIARLDYQIPTATEQAQIWRVLLAGCGAKMNDATIRMVVEANPKLSGRDIKNLLKLARVMQPGFLGPGTIEFVKQFKPTGKREN